MGAQRPVEQADVIAIRRRTLLLGAFSALLVGGALQGYAAGYPLGMVLLAGGICQAGLCMAIYRSDLLQFLLCLDFMLFLAHALLVTPFLKASPAAAIAAGADLVLAALAGLSLVYMPFQTMALVVREAYLQQCLRRRRQPGS